jgi:hypothetical protein
MDENIRPPSAHSSHSSHSMLDLSAAETVKEFEENPSREETIKRRVNFGEECDDGEEAGMDDDEEEEEDSMPLDISRYDNVQSSIHAREKATAKQKSAGKFFNNTVKWEMGRTKLRRPRAKSPILSNLTSTVIQKERAPSNSMSIMSPRASSNSLN